MRTKTLARSLADPTYEKHSPLLTDASRTRFSCTFSYRLSHLSLGCSMISIIQRGQLCFSPRSECEHLQMYTPYPYSHICLVVCLVLRAPPDVHTSPILTHLPGCSSCTASTSKCTHLTNTHTSAWLPVQTRIPTKLHVSVLRQSLYL